MKWAWLKHDFGIVNVAGKDARDFLQRLTSQDFRAVREGESLNGAALTPTSQVQALFTAVLKGSTFHLLCESNELAETLFAFLEKMHFAEDMTLEKRVNVSVVVTNFIPEKRPAYFAASRGWMMAWFENSSESSPYFEGLKGQGVQAGSDLDWTEERAKAGFAKWGHDITEKNLILEGPFDDFVSRDKGCYPGQEVVERVFTYGNVAKKLVQLQGEPQFLAALKPGTPLSAEDKEVGQVVSNYGSTVWAFVRKPHFFTGTEVKAMDSAFKIIPIPHSFEIESKS